LLANDLPPVEEHGHHGVRAAEHLSQHPGQKFWLFNMGAQTTAFFVTEVFHI
jgi:hypothetical protein